MNKIIMAELTIRQEICYLALVLSILTSRTPEQSFEYLDPREAKNGGSILTDRDIEDMIEMRKTMNFDQIAECYGITKSACFH